MLSDVRNDITHSTRRVPGRDRVTEARSEFTPRAVLRPRPNRRVGGPDVMLSKRSSVYVVLSNDNVMILRRHRVGRRKVFDLQITAGNIRVY
ncbi:hypothetical protein EVAR_104016_1 [Eumeta japonica]|uniref:Uncharacterized protein n=1 Tax=Eumeta variegata TaxID=151549 RepID=A0A4C1XWX3_EUMVA|nr:hypothetical protein EVAR_104016_1 [Eumeta japonica]